MIWKLTFQWWLNITFYSYERIQPLIKTYMQKYWWMQWPSFPKATDVVEEGADITWYPYTANLIGLVESGHKKSR